MNKKLICLVCIFISVISIDSVQAKKLKVVTTLTSLESITQYIGGEHVSTSAIARGAQDAHFIQAKPSYMVKLKRADLLIYSGMELEIGWLPLLIQGSRNRKLAAGGRGCFNASTAIHEDHILEKPRGELDRSMGDVHPRGNPHYILNPHNALKVAEYIAEKLIQCDPKNKDDYEKNLLNFSRELRERIKQWESKTAYLKGLDVICYHTHWSYLLDWLGMKSIGYIELKPGIPPSPRHKKWIEQLVIDKGINMVLISSWKEPTKAREVANTGNAKLVILPGEVQAMEGSDDYISWIDHIISALTSINLTGIRSSEK